MISIQLVFIEFTTSFVFELVSQDMYKMFLESLAMFNAMSLKSNSLLESFSALE